MGFWFPEVGEWNKVLLEDGVVKGRPGLWSIETVQRAFGLRSLAHTLLYPLSFGRFPSPALFLNTYFFFFFYRRGHINFTLANGFYWQP